LAKTSARGQGERGLGISLKLGVLASLFAAAIVAVGPVQAAVFRVDVASGVDTGACGAAASPCASIQQAVNNAGDGDVILVAQGTYTYQVALDPCGTDTAVVCVVEKSLTVTGGYAPPAWDTSDPVSNLTTIDGENLYRGVVVKKTFPGSVSNASLTLRGFTIERGRVEGTTSDPDAFGGGVKAVLVASLTLQDLTISDCSVVGATVSSGPGGIGVGGGVYISTSVSLPRTRVTLRGLSFSGNSAQGGATSSDDRGGFAEGGGLFVNRAVLDGSNLVFTSNSVQAGSSSGSGTTGFVRSEALGGGIAILQETDAALSGVSAVLNSVAGGNASNSGGIGGTGAGGGVYVEGSSLQLRDSELRGNSTTGGAADTGGLGSGGGLTSFDADVLFDRVALIENQATGGDGVTKKGSVGGGGAYLERANDATVTAIILNSIFGDNRIDLGAGGGVVGGGGGGLFVLGNDASLAHTTFAQNVLGASPLVGQAVVVAPRNGSPSAATIVDSVIADHTSLTNVAAVQAQTTDSSVTFDSGLFAGNERNTNDGLTNAGTISGLETMATAGSAGFASPGVPSFDYHLTAGSPAIDQAVSSSTELDVDRTFRNLPRDWGADEYCSAATDNLVLSGDTVNNSREEIACHTITVGPSYTVGGSGSLVLRAGERIVLLTGFSVASGGSLVVDGHVP